MDSIYVRHGALKKKWNNSSFKYKDHKKYLFVLFNDILIYAERPKATDFCTLKHAIQLNKMELRDLPDTNSLTNAWVISSEDRSFTVYAATAIEKQEWLSDMQRYISAAKKELVVQPRLPHQQTESSITSEANRISQLQPMSAKPVVSYLIISIPTSFDNVTVSEFVYLGTLWRSELRLYVEPEQCWSRQSARADDVE